MEMNTTVADFCALERQRVIKFYEWYTQMHRTDPEHYPLDLPMGMWDEQFQTFDEGNL